MSKASIPLKISLALVMAASAIELGFVSATVAYLAKLSKGSLPVNAAGASSPSTVPGLPAHLLVNQGHTSNGAAGTGLVIIAFAGFLALWLRGRPSYYGSSSSSWFARAWYRLWVALQVPALLLTLGALVYVSVVTEKHAGQRINLGAVDGGGDDAAAYPLLEWTPQGWFVALSKLDLVDGGDREEVDKFVRITRGWQWNLVPFFVVQAVETVLALVDARRRRREANGMMHGGGEKGVHFGSQ